MSVFGVGKDLEKRTWDSVFRQLVAGNYLEVDLDGYGTFKLNERSWAVLKEGQKVFLREDPPQRVKAKGARRDKTPAKLPAEWTSLDTSLFEALRTLRLQLAKEQNLPPYVVFHDSALREMAARRPKTLSEFAQIPGVGEAKLKKYGPAFLEVLKKS